MIHLFLNVDSLAPSQSPIILAVHLVPSVIRKGKKNKETSVKSYQSDEIMKIRLDNEIGHESKKNIKRNHIKQQKINKR